MEDARTSSWRGCQPWNQHCRFFRALDECSRQRWLQELGEGSRGPLSRHILVLLFCIFWAEIWATCGERWDVVDLCVSGFVSRSLILLSLMHIRTVCLFLVGVFTHSNVACSYWCYWFTTSVFAHSSHLRFSGVMSTANGSCGFVLNV